MSYISERNRSAWALGAIPHADARVCSRLTQAVIDSLRDKNQPRARVAEVPMVGGRARVPIELSADDLTQATLLLIGHEARGLIPADQDTNDLAMTIPLGYSASSLHAACAASVMLYEVDHHWQDADRAQ